MVKLHVEKTEKRRTELQVKMKMICSSVNKRLEWSLNNMLINSSHKIKDLVRYLLLGLSVDGHHQSKFDKLMSESMYILKCQGMDKFNQVPVHMTWGHHPRSLYSREFSPFKRKIHLIRYYGRYYMGQIKKGRLF